MAEQRGYVTDPKSWGAAIKEVGPNYAVIFALLALLGYLAFQGVPAVMALTGAIQRNTDVTSTSALRQEGNQTQIINQHGAMIQQNSQVLQQNGQTLDLLQKIQAREDHEDTRLDKLEADEYAHHARQVLRGEQ